MRNSYLMERAYRKRMDGRNTYGPRGGYVVSGRMREKDYGMDYRPTYSEHNSGFYGSNDKERDYGNYNYGSEYNRQYNRPMEYEMYGYGVGGIYMPENYRKGRRDYGSDYSEEEERMYREDLEKWVEHLKKYDRFGLSREEVIRKAEEMGVKFEKFDKLEFYAVYLMLISDFKQVANDPHYYLAMTKEWLEDEDIARKGSEKVCAYLYDIVLGE